MAYIDPVPEGEASGTVKEIYDEERASSGYVPNHVQLLGHRPDVHKAWVNLGTAISRNMSYRRYELVTLAAARRLRGTACMAAHGEAFLHSGEVDEAQLAAIARDYHNAQLTAAEVAVMEFAEKVIADANSITQADVDRLRSHGMSDAEVLDVTLAAAFRSFVSKTVDSLNVGPDPGFMKLGADLRDVLCVGRDFANE